MDSVQKTRRPKIGKEVALFALGAAIIAAGGYAYYRVSAQNKNLEATLLATQSDLASAKNDSVELSDALTNANQTIDAFQGQLSGLSSTVGTLQKLSTTDPELLKKYSKVYFLNENYVPKGLTAIDANFLFTKGKPLQFLSQASPFLEHLLTDASSTGLRLEAISAYRSFGTQSGLKASYDVTYGAGTANSFSAEQGYSEHQLGTAVDFTTPSVGSAFVGFEKTPEYAWLTANAYKYGFILSYPKGNQFYVYEPWHWRFVGTALAAALHSEGENFYDLDQRDIDSYLVNIFD